MATADEPLSAPGVRWWPFVLVTVLATIAITVIQVAGEDDQQRANIRSVGTGLIAFLLVLLWFFVFSRCRGATRLRGLFGLVLAMALVATFVRVRGVTGDLIPIFELRSAAAPPPEVVAAPETDAGPARAPGLADSPQFFGPDRTGKLDGPVLKRDWQRDPPTESWRRSIGAGWSGFAVVGRRAITQEQHGGREMVVCYDVISGDVLWTHADEARYESALAGVGPRATPTIAANRVFTLGATGILNCLEAATGAVVWSKDILADNAATQPEWGVAGSPLLHGDLVVVCAGGAADRSLVAYDRATGNRVWSSGSEPAHYSSPITARIGGVDQVLIFNAGGVAAHGVEDGRSLWSYPWNRKHAHICMPVVVGNRVLISSGYGEGAALVAVTRDDGGAFAVERVWRSRAMKAKFTNVITKDGFVYGLDDGRLACVDLEDGRRRWKSGRYGHGQILLVSDLLLVMAESGDVVLVEPVPDEARELTRFTAFADKTWNPPTLAGEYLLVRNDVEAACYRLPVE